MEASAAEHNRTNENVGTVVYVKGDRLVTKDDAGREHTHVMRVGAEVIRRGRVARVSDLTAGARVRITELSEDPGVATAVESLRIPGSVLD